MPFICYRGDQVKISHSVSWYENMLKRNLKHCKTMAIQIINAVDEIRWELNTCMSKVKSFIYIYS